MPFPFANPDPASMLASRSIPLVPQRQYMDACRLDVSGVRAVPNHAVTHRLGFSDVQRFAGGGGQPSSRDQPQLLRLSRRTESANRVGEPCRRTAASMVAVTLGFGAACRPIMRGCHRWLNSDDRWWRR